MALGSAWPQIFFAGRRLLAVRQATSRQPQKRQEPSTTGRTAVQLAGAGQRDSRAAQVGRTLRKAAVRRAHFLRSEPSSERFDAQKEKKKARGFAPAARLVLFLELG